MSKLTVAEYAEKHSITKQAVYKRINNLNTIEEDRNGRKITLIIEEEEEQKPESKELNPSPADLNPISTDIKPQIQPNSTADLNPIQPNLNPDSQPISTEEQGDELNPSIIEILKTQLEEKDRQIERLQEAAKEKDQQLKEQFDRFTALLMRSQELEALTHKLLLEQGEDQEKEEEAEIIPAENKEESGTEETADQEPPKKRSFWSRLFKRE